MPGWSWILLVVAGVLWLAACCRLAADARGGCTVSMGGDGLFSAYWVVGAIAATAGLAMRPGTAWWWAVVVFVALYLLKGPVYRAIVARWLGTGMPPSPGSGFKRFIRRIERDERDERDEDSS